ncbi:MAG TPA: ribosome maturation factor RimP [Acidimicrobiales bacterium]|nr:ribosome maturation factor RimP [Acidimicrobiales bacterium]
MGVTAVPSSDAIRALVQAALETDGLELWDVEIERDVVRLLVDRPGGIDLDALASVAGRVVSPLLDEHPEVTPDGQYSLEVSSPGVERTLRRPEHYRRYVGTEVAVKTRVAVNGARRHQGRLVSVDDDGVTVAAEGGLVTIAHRDIERARTVLVWGPAPKPGHGSKPGQGSKPGKGAAKKQSVAKRSATDGRAPADQPIASRERDSE